jgi:hypothetical protein
MVVLLLVFLLPSAPLTGNLMSGVEQAGQAVASKMPPAKTRAASNCSMRDCVSVKVESIDLLLCSVIVGAGGMVMSSGIIQKTRRRSSCSLLNATKVGGNE